MKYGEEIGERIRKLREEKGRNEGKELRQSDVAAAINMSRSNYAKLEAGERDLKTTYCTLLAEYFETSCDYIIRGIESRNVEASFRTGLSNESIERLSYLKMSDRIQNTHYIDTLNYLITTESSYAIACISNYLRYKPVNQSLMLNGSTGSVKLVISDAKLESANDVRLDLAALSDVFFNGIRVSLDMCKNTMDKNGGENHAEEKQS